MQPKPTYQAIANPSDVVQFPDDPSLSIFLKDLHTVSAYWGATHIAVLRAITHPSLVWQHNGEYASLKLDDAGTLVLIRFAGCDDGPPAEHFCCGVDAVIGR